jgi:hypothetical protein
MSRVTTSFIVPHEEVCVFGKGNEFRFNYKIMIMVTRNLWSARVSIRDWLCKVYSIV